MSDLDREHLLQKVVAVSGFLFALLILPVAQYFLVNGRATTSTDQGTVAGVSTDTTVTNADVPAVDPAACIAKKTQDLADLQRFYDGEIAALDKKHPALVQEKDTLAAMTADTPVEQRDALTGVIATEQSEYDAAKAPIQTAVDKEAKRLSGQDCGVVPTATPVSTPVQQP